MTRRACPCVVISVGSNEGHPGKRCRAMIYDISYDGCMAEFEIEQFDVHDQLMIKSGLIAPLAGRLIWRKGRLGGIRFNVAPSEGLLAQVNLEMGYGAPIDAWLHDRFGRRLPRRSGRSRLW